MKTETFKGTIRTYKGKKLEQPLNYEGSYQSFETADEAKEAKAWPEDTDKFILAGINSDRQNVARSATVASTLQDAGLGEIGTRLQDADYRVRTFVNSLVAAGKDRAEAEALAVQLNVAGSK